MKLNRGFYAAFEGIDGSGKSTIIAKVVEIIKTRISDEIIVSYHPGSTKLGAHIRQLVKYPQTIDENIEIDNLSRQMLYMVDTINFVNNILLKGISENKMMLSDRNSYISSLIYSVSEGKNLSEIQKLLNVFVPPRMDKLFILDLSAKVSKERVKLKNDSDGDHYDNQPSEFFEKLADTYKTLETKSFEQTSIVGRYVNIADIIHIDAEKPINDVANQIGEMICDSIIDRCIAPFNN